MEKTYFCPQESILISTGSIEFILQVKFNVFSIVLLILGLYRENRKSLAMKISKPISYTFK